MHTGLWLYRFKESGKIFMIFAIIVTLSSPQCGLRWESCPQFIRMSFLKSSSACFSENLTMSPLVFFHLSLREIFSLRTTSNWAVVSFLFVAPPLVHQSWAPRATVTHLRSTSLQGNRRSDLFASTELQPLFAYGISSLPKSLSLCIAHQGNIPQGVTGNCGHCKVYHFKPLARIMLFQ